ncbi:hypothetical protein SLL00_04810 [Metabacillus indicus]|uniref:hypothetical protein n=1 Tax=Metabacillus indicus TaxID=246786 RepID=UPI002A035F90|nr:hypothetical protein [Metabacillus indicus]MDX8289097.1 hypothetical protein [Metabacillus indicus]
MEQLWIQSELSEGPALSAGLFQLVLHYTAIKKKSRREGSFVHIMGPILDVSLKCVYLEETIHDYPQWDKRR